MNKYSLPDSSMDSMWELITKLFPIHRTLVNEGFRESIEIIKEKINLTVLEYNSGMHVWDWIIPDAWNAKDAYVKDSNGRKLIDLDKSNIHLAPYSVPFQGKLSGKELLKHICTLPDQPDAIPYRTLYNNKEGDWKFCIEHNDLDLFDENENYNVLIDVDIKPGKLLIGEYYLPGKKEEEIVFSTYLCHPSLANDNLTGVAVAVEIMKILSEVEDREYSYRLLIVPEGIGAITYLATHEDQIEKILGGYVFTCCGDPGSVTYKKSYSGNSIIDRAASHVVKNKYEHSNYSIRNFWLHGSDEQKYNGTGVRLPFGCFTRTPYGEFEQYHTSKDNLDFIERESLFDFLDTILETLYVLENDEVLKNNYKSIPFFSKHGIHRYIDSKNVDRESDAIILRMLGWEIDGVQSLLDIAEKWNFKFRNVHHVSRDFLKVGLAEKL